MTYTLRILPLAVALGLAWSGRPARAEDIRAAIEKANEEFIAAVLRGDAKAAAALYTDDAKVLPPGTRIASGREAITAYWKSTIDVGVKDLKLETVDAEAAGDLAYETGNLTVTSTDGNVTTSRYVVVWKRAGGRWRLHRDIWN
jgi:uncharacterized protein (TIGR02246 family)